MCRLLQLHLFLLILLVAVGCEDEALHPEEAAGEQGTATTVHEVEPISYEEPTGEPTKRALLIGINRYKNKEQVSNLAGCVNDVQKMKAVLVGKFEFPPENVLVLTDERANRAAIIGAIQDHLIAKAQRDDIVVIHYSGHGSQMKDNSGDETDGWDETIVPHDSRQGDVFDISDDEINGLLGQLERKTRNITFIFDSCHSGTGSRASGLARKAAPDPRDPPPPASFAAATRGADPEGGLRQRGANFVLLSGARSDQLAFEHLESGRNAEYGAFTYFLTEALERAGPGATYRDVMDAVRSKVEARYGRQTPQMEGTGEESYIFSDSTGLSDLYIPASPASGGKVTLRAGQAHGMTAGSLFDVYAPGTKQFESPAVPTARVRLTRTGAFESEGEIVGGGRVDDNARAVEREHVYGDQKLLVYFERLGRSPTLQSVKARIDALNHVAAHPRSTGYTLLLREKNGRIEIEGPDAALLSPPVPAGEANSVDRVVEQVEQWAKWFNLLSIENPASRVRDKVKLHLTDESGRPFTELAEGDTFQGTVENGSDRDLFITILDLSTDGSVAQIFPDPDAAGAELLPRGQRRTLSFPVYVPEGRTAVRDYIKVFATSTPMDLRFMTQPPVRGRDLAERGADDPLERLLAQATVGATRGVGQAINLGDWATMQKAFTVKRRAQ